MPPLLRPPCLRPRCPPPGPRSPLLRHRSPPRALLSLESMELTRRFLHRSHHLLCIRNPLVATTGSKETALSLFPCEGPPIVVGDRARHVREGGGEDFASNVGELSMGVEEPTFLLSSSSSSMERSWKEVAESRVRYALAPPISVLGFESSFVSLYDRDDVESVGLDDAARRLGVERRQLGV